MLAFNLLFTGLVLAGVATHIYYIVTRVRSGDMDVPFAILFGLFGALALPLIPLMWAI